MTLTAIRPESGRSKGRDRVSYSVAHAASSMSALSARFNRAYGWELFGEANGAPTLQDLRRQVGQYRQQPLGPREDPIIGSIFVRDTVFFPLDAPSGPLPEFASNLVQGKGYDLAAPSTGSYFEDILERLLGRAVEFDLDAPWHITGPMFGDPRLAPRRLGQRAF